MSNILNQIKLSGVTYTIEDSTALHTLDDSVTSGGTNAVKGSGVYSAIIASTSALAESINNMHYQTSSDVQNAISGKVDTDTYTAYTAATNTILSGKADISDIPSVTGYADSVQYNSTSKYVEFYHGGTGGTKVFEYDASPFLIDGMVESVVITSITSGGSEVQVLEITWNSAAGGQVTDIPISEIFDASNYYTKTEVDNIVTGITQDIEEATSGKADSSTVDTINNTLTAHTADATIHVTSSDKATWSGKQDALVSGTNIKTINGNSILGSGNIDVQTLPTVDGTTLVFS